MRVVAHADDALFVHLEITFVHHLVPPLHEINSMVYLVSFFFEASIRLNKFMHALTFMTFWVITRVLDKFQ